MTPEEEKELEEAARAFCKWVETRPKHEPKWIWWQGMGYSRQPDGSWLPDDEIDDGND